MIVVDTSALIAVLLQEPGSAACVEILKENPDLLVSAGTLAEALIVAEGRGLRHEMERLIGESDFEVTPVTAAETRRVGEAYRRWGKGFHAAKLNFGDCFAYALAKERACPLLYVGGDFARTDIVSAIA